MGCENENEVLSQFERNKYFYGKLMTVKDFELEQNYFNGKRKLLNRFIHGIGIVRGLEVTVNEVSDNKINVTISPGAALDCLGNEIVVGQSSGENLEINGDISQLNCIYIRYEECEKDLCPVISNVSNCNESCCPSKYEESFTLELGNSPDNGKNEFKGVVQDKNGNNIGNALVIALDENGFVESITKTDNTADNKGNFVLKLDSDPNSYEIIVISVDNGIQGIGPVNLNSPLKLDDLNTQSVDDLFNKLSEKNFKPCDDCNDPKVLLAVIKSNCNNSDKTNCIDIDETQKYRTMVFNNPLLHGIITKHMADFNNPHGTTAKQVGALKGLKIIGKDTGDPLIGTAKNDGDYIKIKEGNNIALSFDNTKKQITIASTATGGTSTPIPEPASAAPTSVGINSVLGGSAKYALEDHVHSNASILATSDSEVESVGTIKSKGSSSLCAREDHVHDNPLMDLYVRQRTLEDIVIKFTEVEKKIGAISNLPIVAKQAVYDGKYIETDDFINAIKGNFVRIITDTNLISRGKFGRITNDQLQLAIFGDEGSGIGRRVVGSGREIELPGIEYSEFKVIESNINPERDEIEIDVEAMSVIYSYILKYEIDKLNLYLIGPKSEETRDITGLFSMEVDFYNKIKLLDHNISPDTISNFKISLQNLASACEDGNPIKIAIAQDKVSYNAWFFNL